MGNFRAKGYFIGSGVVEAGCKTVIGARVQAVGHVFGRNRALKTSWRCAVSAQQPQAGRVLERPPQWAGGT